MKKAIFILPLLQLLFYGISAANDYTVTVHGNVFGADPSRGMTRFPLKGLKIELVDSDADGSQIFDDVMGTAVVNADGSFTVTGTGGDPGSYSWSKPDVYIRFVYNYYDKVRLTDELNRTRYTNTPEHDHNNFEGDLDIGTWIINQDAGAGEGSMCGIWFQVCRAWDDYVAIMGEEPKPGYCDVEYWSAIYAGTPWTNDNTIHWPTEYSSKAAKHEFGHIIRHSFDGDRGHFDWDVTRFRYARYHSACANDCNNWSTESKEIREAFAFNEGWAEFWAGEYVCSSGLSHECEGGVATILQHIESDLTNSGRKARKFMCQVLKNNPGRIHSIHEFISRLNEMLGTTVYDVRIRRKVPLSEPTKMIILRNLSAENASAATNKKLEMLSTYYKTITATRRKARPCSGTDCDIQAEAVLNAKMMDNKKLLLGLRQDMLQQTKTNVFFDEATQKNGIRNAVERKTSLRNTIEQQYIQTSISSANSAIKELESMEGNSYAAQLAEELSQKIIRMQSAPTLYNLSYDLSDWEAIKKGTTPPVQQEGAKPVIEKKVTPPPAPQEEAKPVIEKKVTPPPVQQEEAKPVMEKKVIPPPAPQEEPRKMKPRVRTTNNNY